MELRNLISHWGVLSTEMQEVVMKDEKMTQLVGTEIVTSDIDEMPEPVSPVVIEDVSNPEFSGAVNQVNLDDL